MRLQLALLVAFNIAGAAEDSLRLVRETDALTPEQEQTKLHAPAGFTVQLFASEPMINKPINMAFDARGRLWVSSTVEYPYAAAKDRWSDAHGSHVKDSRDAIKILEDTDGDGTADKVTDFADGLNIPTGVLPWHKPEHKAGCIAWSIPNIWYFADTDGDGRCDRREVLFGPLGYEKDTHGMCSSFRLGLDGWVYATHGFNNTSHLKAKDGSTLDLHSGNVFRFRPDGSHVEIWSWGQVNPFGLCWDRYNNLYSADCHSNPITQLIRGAYYPSFGKPHDGLGYGPVMCEHSHGSTGLCGIIYIDGGVWGKEWDYHMFLGNCVTSKVNHDKITFAGSTPKANEQPDFITSDDPWFRPVDLQLGPDHALYIADFYNTIIGHYEVPLDHPGRDKERGRIWRIVKNDAKPAPADFTVMSSKQIADELGNPNLTRRHLALREVKRRGTKEWLPDFLTIFDPECKVVPMGDSRPKRIKPWDDSESDQIDPAWPTVADMRAANTLWALSYLGERLLVSEVLRWLHGGGVWREDEGESLHGLLMSQAVHIIGSYEQFHPWEKWNLGVVFDYRGSAAGSAACEVLLNRPDFLGGDPHWQEWMIDILTRLMNSMISPRENEKEYPWIAAGDPQYVHAMRLLLRDFLSQPDALSVMGWSYGDYNRAPWISEIVAAVPTADAARYLAIYERVSDQELRHIANYGDADTIRSVMKIVRRLRREDELRDREISACAALNEGFMQRGLPPKEFLDWATELAEFLLARSMSKIADSWINLPTDNSETPWCHQDRKCADGKTISVISSLNASLKGPEKLTGILRSQSFAAPDKLSFWLCGHQGFPGTTANKNNLVRLVDEHDAVLHQAYPPRNDVAQRIEWDLAAIKGKPVRFEIVDGDDGAAYAWLGVGRFEQHVLSTETFNAADTRQRQLATLAGILRTTAPVGLRDRLAAYLPQPARIAKPKPQPEIDALIKERIASFAKAKPDVEIGENVFKMNCAVCHQIKSEGGLIGPQLDGIGNRGAERLIEDILDTNRNVDAHFHLHQMKLRDGSTATGFVRGEVGQVTILVDATGNEQRISKGDIVEDTDLPQSLMPPTFGQTIPPDAFNDLIGWLLKR